MKGFVRFCFYFLFVSSGLSALGQTVPTKSVSVSAVVEYTVKPIATINTNKSEFGAVSYNKGIVYVSEQKKDLVNFENEDPNGNPYLDVYYVERHKDEYNKKTSFSKKHNSEYHDGPIAFNTDFTQAFLTRAVSVRSKNKSFVNQSKLFILNKKGKGWSKPKPFTYNNDAYSLGHASISNDNKKLFFASDMPGGFGGTDIYVSEWTGTEWAQPKNLGASVNSAGNELYPFIRKDGVLFFASNKNGGLGGLDIYSAHFENKQWIQERNEGININSTGDDFAVFFSDSVSGYLSSNREGNDNLYEFTFAKKYIDFDGFVLNSKDIFDPSKNLNIELTDSSGNKISETRTDENGYFKFRSLNSDETYLVRIDETDSAFNGKKHYYLADKNYTILRVTSKKGEDKFVFKNLPKDANSMPELDVEDDLSIAGNLLSSQNPATPIANAKLVLKDKDGKTIDEATTNSFGSFVFSRIPPDEAYTIELVETDVAIPPGTQITLTNKNGKVIKTLTSDDKGKFTMKFLSTDKQEFKDLEVQDSDLLMDFSSAVFDENNQPIGNLIIYLKDSDLKLLEKDTTDANGKFSFRKLLTNKNYVIEFDENDPRLGLFKKIIIKSYKGKIIKEITKSNGKFNYHILKGDATELQETYVDDPWLSVLTFKNSTEKKEIVIEEKVYYAYGDYNLDEPGKKVLEKVVQIMKDNPEIIIELGSHTDSRANDDFNMKLSEKRAKTAVEYIVKLGIAKTRLKAIGYGETKLKNKCANNVVCSEEEHAQNRRTEFRVISKIK